MVHEDSHARKRLNTWRLSEITYLCAHFHQNNYTEMIKKFAMLATMAALFVACGGNTAEMEAKAKATD